MIENPPRALVDTSMSKSGILRCLLIVLSVTSGLAWMGSYRAVQYVSADFSTVWHYRNGAIIRYELGPIEQVQMEAQIRFPTLSNSPMKRLQRLYGVAYVTFWMPERTFIGQTRGVIVPLWIPFGVLSLVAALSFVPVIIHSQRRHRGLCVRCSYDLRGSPGGICPECGHEYSRRVGQRSEVGHAVHPDRRPRSHPRFCAARGA